MKDLKDLIIESIKINEAQYKMDIEQYLKKTFGKITIDTRKNGEMENPMGDNCDWVEYSIDGLKYDYAVSVAYSPDSNEFSFCIDSVFVKLSKSGKFDCDEENAFCEKATMANLSKYNKQSLRKMIKAYENYM